mgnify:CR=1 FL=1
MAIRKTEIEKGSVEVDEGGKVDLNDSADKKLRSKS